MNLVKARPVERPELSIAPLIDVVFLLIIFFMVVTQITQVQVEDLELPEARQSEPEGARTAGRLVVNIREDGDIVMDGRRQTTETVRSALADAVKRVGADKTSVLIRGDRRTAWKQIARVLAACAANRIQRVRVAVTEPGA